MELVELQNQLEAFQSRDVRIVAASVEKPEDLRTMRDSAGASFDFFSDPEGRFLDLLNVRHVGADPVDGGDLPQSSSFLVSPDGTVLWSHLAVNYRLRPAPERILEVVDELVGS